MSLKCPACAQHALHPEQLEPGLPAMGCPECHGALLALVSWRQWRERGGAADAPMATGAGAGEVEDSPSALRCPKCSGFMTKYRIAADAKNQVDHCAHCGEVWLDHGEWELLERFALSDQLGLVLGEPWQKRVRNEAARLRAEERWKARLGADYARAAEIRAWLDAHPNAKELLAYLYTSQTD